MKRQFEFLEKAKKTLSQTVKTWELTGSYIEANFDKPLRSFCHL